MQRAETEDMLAGPILAIDTSGVTASVALFQEQVRGEMAWKSGRNHSAQLLPAIDTVVRLAQVDKHDLVSIAVAAGPGSYSGLRVGVSTAMALALALNLEVVQVPTLDVMAWSVAAASSGEARAVRPVRAAIDVGRGHYATARFRRVGSQLEHESRIQSVGLGELLELATVERSLLVVDLDGAARENAERHYGAKIELASPAASMRRAGFLAELAALKIRRGELVGGSVVEPIYLHN
jgi:tRNA threonylcarbamoyladenosine biosynthesis protein TsaB